MPNLIVSFSGKSRDCRELHYGGKTLKPGQSFEATDKDARLLKAFGKAIDAPTDTRRALKEVKAPRRTRVEPEAGNVPSLSVEPAPSTPESLQPDMGFGGSYGRRDMRAED